MSETEKIYRIVVINPGSTSTKISLFENEKHVFEKSVFHEASVMLQFPHVNDQIPFREEVMMNILKDGGIDPSTIDAVSGRGGGAYSQPGGVTLVDQKLYDDTVACKEKNEHPSKLGVMMAWDFAQKYHCPAYTMNPTNTDEYHDLARLTGIKGVHRISHSHVLNQKAVAEYHAKTLGGKYEDYNFIVAHIDGGITVAAHEHGRMIDGSMGADGEGAYTPTRIGYIPVQYLLDYVKEHTIEETRLMCNRSGGFVSLLGTSNSDTVHAMVEAGDPNAVLVWNTMIYQVAKMIGEMAPVLCGKIDGILLTGGLLRFPEIGQEIKRRCDFIAPVHEYPGEMEQEALAYGALKALRGEVQPHIYAGKPVWDGFKDLDI